MSRSLKALLLWAFLAIPSFTPPLADAAAPDDTALRQIIIFGRHGVRSPTVPESKLAAFAIQPYPKFEVPPGYLTPHGAQAAVLLGTYFREYLAREGLISANATAGAARSYFRANSIQRSNATAAALASGIFPGVDVPVHSYPLGVPDPVFDPIAAKVVTIDPARATSEVTGIFGSGPAVAAAYAPEFTLIRDVLLGSGTPLVAPEAAPPDRVDAARMPIPLVANAAAVATSNVIDSGGLSATLFAADPFVMQYTNGFAPEDVAWGRLTPETLSQQTRVITLFFDIEMLPPYLNRRQSSNAAAHVLRSLEQAAGGKRVPGAFGDPESRVLVINSSDAYVAGLAGLLHAHWLLPGYQRDYCAPDGAIVLELRQSRRSGKYFVRGYYVAQSFDQLRNLTPLSLAQPPGSTQLLLPGSRDSAEPMDVPLARFKKALEADIDPTAVQNPGAEHPPGRLRLEP